MRFKTNDWESITQKIKTKTKQTKAKPNLNFLKMIVTEQNVFMIDDNPEVVGSIPTEVKRNFSLPRVVP